MMPRTTLTVLALVLLLGWAGQALDDHSADYDVAASLDDARQQAAYQAQYAAAVQRQCGPNAAYMELQDGEIQCTDKYGRPTQRLQLTARATP
jgi:hypothetical protein